MQVEANGCVFECRIDGDCGAWVTLSHGLATDMLMWDELADVLRERFRVLRYNARGHGNSQATPGDYTLALLVADVVAILDALNVDRTHVVGLSMGGMVAQGLMLDHPHRVRSAVIADSRHTTTPEFTKAWHQRAATVRKDGVDAIVASTVERWSSSGLAERNPAVVRRMEKMIRATSADGYCGCAAALAELNYGSRLGEIGCPVLVMCGTEDHGAPPENTRQMHQMIPNSEFVEIPQAGHIASIEQPAMFNRAVLDFLDRVEGKAPWLDLPQ
jgi:3-oxoadipate enol-lactonase